MGICFKSVANALDITSYVDSNFAGDLNRRSIIGCVCGL